MLHGAAAVDARPSARRGAWCHHQRLSTLVATGDRGGDRPGKLGLCRLPAKLPAPGPVHNSGANSLRLSDLGCGKGRSLVVASELPFRKIVGIEIAPDLAKTARVNAAVVDKRFPRRTLIEVTTGDASLAPLPEGDLVIFLYHSFGENLLRHLVTRLVEAAPGRTIFFVYENPAYGRLLDAAPGFSRWFAEMVPCDPVERGYAPNDSEAIVIWRSGGDVSQAELLGCQARIEGTPWRAVLAPVDARLEGAAHMS